MQTKIRLEIELEYDPATTHGEDQAAIDWFKRDVLCYPTPDGSLILHSNEIGDTVGSVRVTKFLGPIPGYERCQGANRYLARKAPTCGCRACWEKWERATHS